MPDDNVQRAVPTLAEAAGDIAACRATLRVGSYTFYAASMLLPRGVRGPASALYAFCRLADDAVDGGRDPHAAVAALHGQLAAVYQGTGSEPGDRALAAVVAHFGIPRELPHALLEGFLWDAQGRRYDTLDELEGYAARVAGSVGAMMSLLMGARDAAILARACDLGVAMQLSNIARDVGEDARAGRLYLPLQWLREAGIDPGAWLARPVFDAPLASVVQRLLDAADRLYARAGAGVGRLPLGCRPGINAARFMYAAIGHQVARNGLDSVSRRAVVPGRRKAGLMLRALVSLSPSTAALQAECLPANRFLVDSAVAARPRRPQPALAWWQLLARLDAQVARTVDLFDRLDREQRARMRAPLA